MSIKSVVVLLAIVALAVRGSGEQKDKSADRTTLPRLSMADFESGYHRCVNIPEIFVSAGLRVVELEFSLKFNQDGYDSP